MYLKKKKKKKKKGEEKNLERKKCQFFSKKI